MYFTAIMRMILAKCYGGHRIDGFCGSRIMAGAWIRRLRLIAFGLWKAGVIINGAFQSVSFMAALLVTAVLVKRWQQDFG